MNKLRVSPVPEQSEQATAYAAANDAVSVEISNAECTGTGVKRKTSKTMKKNVLKPVSEFKPKYTDEEVAELSTTTKKVEDEITRIVQECDKYGSVKFGDNVMVDINMAVKNGVRLYGFAVNREHGRDQDTTGASLLANGAQEKLICITYGIAMACDIKVVHFKNDKEQDSQPSDSDLIVMEGHGRINFVMQYPVDDWPQLYAYFPSKDAAGYYNIPKCMEVINTNRKPWGTPDFMQKRIVEEGGKCHDGWSRINGMLKKGYMYQSACQLLTLRPDRITKRDIIVGDAKNIFANYEDACKILEILVSRFGEGDDKTLKTKEFSKEIVLLWGKLQKSKGNLWATEQFVKFIDELPDEKIAEIKSAKKTSEGVTKDEKRKKLLNEEFYKFIGKYGLKTE